MLEDYIVQNCAPTLACIKTANMFTCPYSSKQELVQAVRQLNMRLVPKGLRLLLLRCSESRALIYLYRPDKLRQDLSHATAARLLHCRGYDTENCERCIVHLAKKLRKFEDFPHEIGLFLGYPPEDVNGFIELGPNCCKCTGFWKVYHNEHEAQRIFESYRCCTRAYCRQYAGGADIECLTVSA
ncbi:MAG: DUF3793 family protein [Oscillospiraceae bacterium]|nr:DUF3793 family protein [Oscillospiraceae bacterium]